MLFHTASKVLTRLFLIRSASQHGLCNVVLVENRLLLGPGLGLQLQKTLRGGSQFTGRGLIAPSHGIGIDVKNENVEREERGFQGHVILQLERESCFASRPALSLPAE
jgi:hypothetical protein